MQILVFQVIVAYFIRVEVRIFLQAFCEYLKSAGSSGSVAAVYRSPSVGLLCEPVVAWCRKVSTIAETVVCCSDAFLLASLTTRGSMLRVSFALFIGMIVP